MDHFKLTDGILHAEDVPLPTIAQEVGTPVYVYSRATLERHARVFREGLGELDNPLILFAVKANPNLAVLRVLQREGFGADVVSGGELRRALAAGMTPDKIVFSGVGKTRAELELGLDTGIAQFNIESREEGRELAELAAARALLYEAATKLDRKTPDATKFCAMAKRFVTDTSSKVANDALQLHGGYGYMLEYPVARAWIDEQS